MSNRKTVFFLPVGPMDKEHKNSVKIDLKAPRLARYMHKAWKKHQNTVYWVDLKLAQKKGFKFYQTRSNAIMEESFSRRYMRHLDFLRKNWVQKLLEELKTPNCKHGETCEE